MMRPDRRWRDGRASNRKAGMMRRTLRLCSAAALVLCLGGFAAFEWLFAPRADLWPKWSAHDPASTASVDHAAWAAFLKTYVKPDKAGVNRVAYGAVTDADKKALHGYLVALRRVDVPALNRAEQLAYWINLYNALTIRVVVDFYPVGSIRDINLSGGLFGGGPWDKKLIRIDGEMISLNDIEHRILRPIWKDPRIHYAVNCAAVGCPNLAAAPYTAAALEAMLNKGARDYVDSPRGVRHTADGLVLSKIYAWFPEDFGGSDALVLDHIAAHASSNAEARFPKGRNIAAYEYDWALNDANRRRNLPPSP